MENADGDKIVIKNLCVVWNMYGASNHCVVCGREIRCASNRFVTRAKEYFHLRCIEKFVKGIRFVAS